VQLTLILPNSNTKWVTQQNGVKAFEANQKQYPAYFRTVFDE
jgi:hypothetical protein